MHQPVLLKEVLEYLDPKAGENFIDGTFGFGGHSLRLLEMNKPGPLRQSSSEASGKVLGIELDADVVDILKKKPIDARLILVQGSFVDLKKIARENNFYPINGILLDVGMSSWQIEQSGRGFSFQRDEPLDMRSDTKSELTAEEIINRWPEKELFKIFNEYGGERFARRIARLICRMRGNRRIKTTGQLVEIIKKAIPVSQRHKKIHFATRVFQALRIAVNSELENLEKALPQALEILEQGGRLAVISFHSLEDKIVKNFFSKEAKIGNLKILTDKPITPDYEEIKNNPRSRSARLRVAMKL
ncbi:MAG: 16S rRNA (cytosine(1402)-N(4))-methyltransferase RsmH [Patescibacteria group bacterium]|nr:16S rRNA (cytosine(1402)-N(4))-methyltransferase RsmH [Patescibacteria group bacterium]